MTETSRESGSTAAEPELVRQFAEIVAKSVDVDPSVVTAETNLFDLGVESIEILEISLDVEEAFNIALPEQDILQTAESVFGEDVLEQGGVLTEAGLRMLSERIPGFAPSSEGKTTVADARRQFAGVEVWHRMIGGLMALTPTACRTCGGALVASPPAQLKCEACGLEHDLPAGDDVNLAWVREYYERVQGAS